MTINQMGRLLLIAFIMASLQACSDSGNTDEVTSGNEQIMSPFDVNLYPLNKVVCDPLNPDAGQPKAGDGLRAELFYLDSTQPRYDRLEAYFTHGTKSNKTLFFSKIDVPTILFDRGFPTESGSMVKTDTGEALTEYFAIKFKSELVLSDEDDEGTYEIALLSDDGSIFKVNDGEGNYNVVVNNDGDHSTMFGCGGTIDMTKGEGKLVQIEYYQGPRMNIALTPMWRKVTSSTLPDPQCGKQGNGMYFDYNNGSTPRAAYLGLLDRGWKPIAAGNWQLPPTAVFNPCVVGDVKITDFIIAQRGENSLRFTWDSNLPGTAQVVYKNLRTGEEKITTADNVFRRKHNVLVTGLTVGDTYEFRAAVIAGRLGKGVSEPITHKVR